MASLSRCSRFALASRAIPIRGHGPNPFACSDHIQAQQRPWSDFDYEPLDQPHQKPLRQMRSLFTWVSGSMCVMLVVHFIVELNKEQPEQIRQEFRKRAKERNPYLKEVDRMFR